MWNRECRIDKVLVPFTANMVLRIKNRILDKMLHVDHSEPIPFPPIPITYPKKRNHFKVEGEGGEPSHLEGFRNSIRQH